ncbi:hypothetical protein BH11ACT5_BH11ACT5_01310 [soil metagenome]
MSDDVSGALSTGETDLVVIDLPKELQSHSGMVGAIYSAIDAQRSVAISYVRGIRRRQPAGTPHDVIKSLERHYVLSVTASGSAVGATAFIPGAGTAIALGAGAAELLLQFELAALFGLAVAEVHGLNIQDRDRARTVILSLMLGQEGRSQVTNLAKAAIRKDATAMTGTAARSRELANATSLDELPLAELLGTAIPTDLVPSVLESVQDLAKKRLPEKVAIAGTRLVPGGIGMILGGIGGYTTGNDVVEAAKQAFGPAPEHLPALLEPLDTDGDGVSDPSAFETGMRSALGSFVKTSGSASAAAAAGMSNAASVVGSGATTAAMAISSPFRSVDLDGDGVPDEARALTTVKGVGRAAAGAAGSLRGATSALFKKKPEQDEEPSAQ